MSIAPAYQYLRIHQNDFNAALTQPLQAFWRDTIINDDGIDPLGVDDLMQAGTVEFCRVGDHDNALRNLTHPTI